jgi:spore maturation protein CgeB
MSKIRLLKASASYSSYLDMFYAMHPDLKDCSYAKQYTVFMDDCYGWADFWKKHLEKNRKFNVLEIIPNNPYMQKKWAKEKGVKYSEENWQLEILEAQISEYKPEIFFCHDGGITKSEFKINIKKKVPTIKIIIDWDGVAFKDTKRFEGCNLILSSHPDTVEFYQSQGINSYLMEFGFESSILDKLTSDKIYNTSFVGGISLFNNGHYRRLKTLASISRETKIDFFLSGVKDWQPWSRSQLDRVFQGKFREFIDIMELGKKNQRTVFGLDMYQVLANSKITLNIHIDSSNHHAGNVRLIEATGCGACLLTDEKNNLSDYFDIDKEVITYKDTNDALDKINYLLSHDKARKEIAWAGQKKTLSKYTFKKSMEHFSKYLLKIL